MIRLLPPPLRLLVMRREAAVAWQEAGLLRRLRMTDLDGRGADEVESHAAHLDRHINAYRRTRRGSLHLDVIHD